MLKFLANEDTWHQLKAISRNRNHPLYVAVPFLGSGGGKLVHLKRGDVLVVALTLANARNGTVCPAEIQRLQSKGVRVFLWDRLHAKVLLCGGKAIVGSANLSHGSVARLDEAAILTTDSSVVKYVRAWFKQRMSELITPKWLDVCAGVYKPPKSSFGPRVMSTKHATEEALWLLGVQPTKYPEDEAGVVESGTAQAKRRLSDPQNSKVESIRFPGDDRFREGDKVIQIMRTANSHYVEELAKLIRIRRSKSRRGTAVAYLFLECRNRPKRFPWAEFRRGCSAYGLKLRPNIGVRQITSPTQVAKVMALVSRKLS
jgi:hypothetical protein